MHTTLIKLKELKPCKKEEIKLLKFLNKETADNCKLEFSTILKAVGIEDATWYLSVLSLKEVSMFNAKVAEISLPIFEKQYPNNMQVRKAIQGSKDYFNGIIEVEDLERLKADTRNVARIAARNSVRDSAGSFAGAAARVSTWDAAWDVARDAAWNAAWDAAGAAAWDIEWGAEWDAVRAPTWKKIEVIFKEEFC